MKIQYILWWGGLIKVELIQRSSTSPLQSFYLANLVSIWGITYIGSQGWCTELKPDSMHHTNFAEIHLFSSNWNKLKCCTELTFVQHLRDIDNCLIQLCYISPKLPTLLLFALACSEIHRCWQIKEMEIVLFLLLFNLLVTKVPVNIWYNLHPTNSPGSVVLLPNSYQVDWHFFLLIIQPVWDHFLNELWYCKGANSWPDMISGWGSAKNWKDCDRAAFLVAFFKC